MKKQVSRPTKKKSSGAGVTVSTIISDQWAEILRPRRLEDFMISENNRLKVKGLLSGNRKVNSILITGPTGTGKTTLARIIAAHLGGMTDHYSKPDSKLPQDIMDMNCGDQTGIENIRQVIKSANFKPKTMSKRIIILDEAHLLSHQAVNALKKPIEEPVGNTTWIICTNEPEKLDSALRSRPIHINLDDIESSGMAKLLMKTASKAGIINVFGREVSIEACRVAAKKAPSNPRRAVTILQELSLALEGSGLTSERDLLKTLKSLKRGSFNTGDEVVGIDSFISLYETDPVAASNMLLGLNDAEAFNELRWYCVGQLRRRNPPESVMQLFVWVIEAMGWSVHNGMNPSHYLAAQILKKHLD